MATGGIKILKNCKKPVIRLFFYDESKKHEPSFAFVVICFIVFILGKFAV